jgi:lipopolysaccharide/colanic/teichoic acid biosynthesis glycosyltransferase
MNSACKRITDLVLAVPAIIFAAPVMGTIGLFVWLESRGNVIFSQERLGLRGKRFRIYKFRKFPIDCGDNGPAVTLASDVRMTKVGAVLERTKLDELPQLWNVIRGDMSFVGPRPEVPRFEDAFEGRYARVLDRMPGIFGPTQVVFTDESHLYPTDEDPEAYYRRVLFPQKAELDLAYFERQNCVRDIGWIIRGVLASVRAPLRRRRFVTTNCSFEQGNLNGIGPR